MSEQPVVLTACSSAFHLPTFPPGRHLSPRRPPHPPPLTSQLPPPGRRRHRAGPLPAARRARPGGMVAEAAAGGGQGVCADPGAGRAGGRVRLASVWMDGWVERRRTFPAGLAQSRILHSPAAHPCPSTRTRSCPPILPHPCRPPSTWPPRPRRRASAVSTTIDAAPSAAAGRATTRG